MPPKDNVPEQPVGMFATLSAVESLVHLPRELFQRPWIDIWYPVEWLPITGGQQAQVRAVQIQSDADFLCFGGVYTATDPANEATFTAPAPLSIAILLSGQQSLVGQVGTNTGTTHINNILGIRGLGSEGKWPAAQLIARNSTLTLALTNLTAATSFNVRAALFGVSVY